MSSEPTSKPLATAQHPVGLTSVALILMTAALWGGTPVAIRYSVVDAFPPVAVAGMRFVLGALFMVVWCWFEGTELRLRTGQFRPAFIAGLMLFVQISFFNVGVALSNASHGSMQINTFVFWVVALEHFVTRTDRLTLRKLVGLAIASSGALLILAETQPTATSQIHEAPTLVGDAFLLASAFVLAIKIVFIKQSLKSIEPGKLIFWHDVIGVVFFAAYSLSFEQVTASQFTTPAVLGIVYQGILVAGLCFAVQAMLLRRHSASQISVFSFTTPIFGVAFAVLLRGDRLSPWLLVSAACVAFGIFLVTFARMKWPFGNKK